MTTTTDGTDTAALLALTQWLSPAFPVGAFAYSHGLEAAIANGSVRDALSLEAWLAAVLEHGTGRTDAILLAHALRSGTPAEDLAALAEALAASRERWVETMEQGAAFTRTVSELTGAGRPAFPLPVAIGLAAADLGLAPVQVVALFLQGFAGNLVSAGVRLVPLGQTEGQGVLARLQPRIAALAKEAVGADLEEIGGAAFGADLSAMEHEDMEVRLFKT